MTMTTQKYRLQRHGERDLVFEGVLLIDRSSKTNKNQDRWTEIRIYRTTTGKYVAETIGRSAHMNEIDLVTVKIADDGTQVADALKRRVGPNIFMSNFALKVLEDVAEIDNNIVVTESI